MNKPNLSTTCNSGPYCFLLNYRPPGGFMGGKRLYHETWEDAARCEKQANAPYNYRPKMGLTARP